MDITTHIDTRLPYRVGYPTLLALPVETEFIETPRHSVISSESLSEIISILLQAGVKGYAELVHRFHERQKTEKITFLVRSHYEPNCQGVWIGAVKAVHDYLLRAKLDFIIEIIDSDISYGAPMPRAIDSEDETFFQAIKKLQPLIMEKMTLNQHAWLALDVLEWYSVEHGEHRPAFIITARDADSSTWWDNTLPWIRARIADCSHDIRVELYYLEAVTFAMDTGHEGGSEEGEDSGKSETKATYVEPHASMLGFYDLPLQVGTSCGLSGSDKSGTWGGRILLTHNGQDMELGLTNSHVLLHNFIQKQESKGPFQPGTLPGQDFVVVSPSDYDHTFALEGLKQTEKETTQRSKERESYFSEVSPTPAEKKNLDLLASEAWSAQTRAGMAEEFGREVGSIFAASGYTARNFCPNNAKKNAYPSDANWALDWALFNIDKKLCKFDKQRTLMMWQPVEPDQKYLIKTQGRTSGEGEGSINAVKSSISFRDGPPLTDPDATSIVVDTIPEAFGGKVITAHCVTPSKGSKKGELIRPGDSGSLVLDKNKAKTVYGLVFGGNEVSKASYMIPAQLLVQDIQDVTGGDNVRFIDWH